MREGRLLVTEDIVKESSVSFTFSSLDRKTTTVQTLCFQRSIFRQKFCFPFRSRSTLFTVYSQTSKPFYIAKRARSIQRKDRLHRVKTLNKFRNKSDRLAMIGG